MAVPWRSHTIDLILDQTHEHYAPVYITVELNPARRVMETDLHMAPVRSKLHPTSVLLEQKEGSITHKMELDGTATVCIRAGEASRQHPLRVGFRIASTELDPVTPTETTDVDPHLTHMEIELRRIQMGMDHILKEADFGKEREAVFHKHTLSMHQATTFWPMVQVCVLLLTGFTQASHIVRFFQSRRII